MITKKQNENEHHQLLILSTFISYAFILAKKLNYLLKQIEELLCGTKSGNLKLQKFKLLHILSCRRIYHRFDNDI